MIASNRLARQPLPPPSARSMLLTVIGEFLYDAEEGAWTAALMKVLGGMGIEDHAARQLLSRAASATWIKRERVGRGVRWHLADHGRALAADGIKRSHAFLDGPSPWDDEWLVLTITVPQRKNSVRNRLNGGLTWLGMGNPTPGVWVTPHVDRARELSELISTLGLTESALVLTGNLHPGGLGNHEVVDRAWDLTDLAESYRTLLTQDGASEPGDDDELLLAYIELVSLQQRFMRLDPQLPKELLPEWIGRDGAVLFQRRREQWAAQAHAHWLRVVEESAPK
ncbi:PaaX family transcriptional regulator C-terminal domain-containing protein [Rhodococcus sp. JVH1]|uniref:PaaX family transcriptional regulator n=1 Tax=Rhodococcus sp. JVH1 TaxID=745408 RepID=UPI000272085D|nr:PaaX family transcriptional regulator C-terminal domain-containing protein [Rhodococcus sp. JVH1]EJI99056.1 paaX-like protein C-terminal domain protein [Rhodococcus sp. JVH1]